MLAVIAEHLELGNEAEDVHYALNSGRQYDESLLELAGLHSPLFRDPSDEMDETWQHGSLIGGMACRDLPQVASLDAHAEKKVHPERAYFFQVTPQQSATSRIF